MFDHARGELVDAVGHLGVVRHDADEFVATQSGQDAAVGQQPLDPRRGVAQHFVTRLVAVQIVDLLEIVEIHRDCRQSLLAPFEMCQQVAQRSSEAAAVVAAGEVVDIR